MQACNNPLRTVRAVTASLVCLMALTQAACTTSGGVSDRPVVPRVQGQAALSRAQVRDADAQFEQGLTALRERRDDEARLIFQALSEAYPELSGPLTNLGILNAQGRDAAQALRDFTRAVEANPRNAVAFNWLGVLHREQGAYGRAEAAYQKAIALDAGYAPAYRNLGVLYDIYLQRPQAAIEQYRQYLTLTQSEDLIVLVWIKELEAQGIATALPIAGAVP